MPKVNYTREEVTALPANDPLKIAGTAQVNSDIARRNAEAAARKAKEAQEEFDYDKAAGIGFQNRSPAMLVGSPDAGRRAPTGGPGQPFSASGPTGPAVTTNSTDIARRMGTMPLPAIRSAKDAVLPRSVTSNDPRIGVIVQPTGYIHPALTRDAVARGANSGTTESRPPQLVHNLNAFQMNRTDPRISNEIVTDREASAPLLAKVETGVAASGGPFEIGRAHV